MNSAQPSKEGSSIPIQSKSPQQCHPVIRQTIQQTPNDHLPEVPDVADVNRVVAANSLKGWTGSKCNVKADSLHNTNSFSAPQHLNPLYEVVVAWVNSWAVVQQQHNLFQSVYLVLLPYMPRQKQLVLTRKMADKCSAITLKRCTGRNMHFLPLFSIQMTIKNIS